MRIDLAFKNPRTGELRKVKVGWSWTLFLFSGVFGIPLFLRKLNIWGFVFLALWIVNFMTNYMDFPRDERAFSAFVLCVIFLCLQIWMGIKGNEMTAKNYLDLGWELLDPSSELVRYAKAKWKIQ